MLASCRKLKDLGRITHWLGGWAVSRWMGELPRREDLAVVFDELDYQLGGQAYLWSLPLVSYAQWQLQHREVFGPPITISCST